MNGKRISPLDAATKEVEASWQKGEEQQQLPRTERPQGIDNGPPISLCGHRIGMDSLAHTMVIGASGSGKTTLMGPTFYSFVRAVTADPTRKLLVIASKEEPYEWLVGSGVPFSLITFTLSQGFSWDIGRDFDSEFLIAQLAKYIFPDNEGDNAFWRISGRSIFTGGCSSIAELTGSCSLPDLVNLAFLDDDRLRQLLIKSEVGRLMANIFLSKRDPELLGKFRSEVATRLQPFFVPAAKCQISENFSLQEWFFGKSLPPIALIQINRNMAEVERPIALTMIRRALELMTSAPLTRRKERVLFIDDMSYLEAIPQLVTTSEMVRGSGGLIVSLSQSFEGLQADYGEKEAEALLTNFPIQILLGAHTQGTAKWSAGQFGEAERYEETFGRSFGGEQVQGREDKRRTVEYRVRSADILNLKSPSPERGFTFYMKSPWGQEFAKHLPWHQVMRRTAPRKRATLTELPKGFQRPAIWSEEDIERLLKGKPSQVNPDASSPSAIDENLALFEEELMQCFHDLVQLGDMDAIQHLSKYFSDHNKE